MLVGGFFSLWAELVFRQLWECYRSSLTLCKKANKHIFPKCQTILLNFHTNYLDLLEALCSWIDEFPQMRVEATYWNGSQVLQVVTLFKYKDGSGTPCCTPSASAPIKLISPHLFISPPRHTLFALSLLPSFGSVIIWHVKLTELFSFPRTYCFWHLWTTASYSFKFVCGRM